MAARLYFSSRSRCYQSEGCCSRSLPNPYGVVSIQLLDGVATGIFGVIAILMTSDLMRGTGRFNLAQGLVALCVGIGAGLSNLSSGFVVQYFGYPTGFLFLATIAAAALIFLRC